jgi:serine protease AprX
LDGTGSGPGFIIIAAIQTAISLKDKYNIRVIDFSLGRQVYESFTQDPLCQAAAAAWRAGVVVVAAAGNSGRDNSLGTNGYCALMTETACDPVRSRPVPSCCSSQQ